MALIVNRHSGTLPEIWSFRKNVLLPLKPGNNAFLQF
jgi:hypothetical protein